MVHGDEVSERGGILVAHECAAAFLDADPEVADTDVQVGVADYVGYGGGDAGIDLHGAEDGGVLLVVEGDEVDVGNEDGG